MFNLVALFAEGYFHFQTALGATEKILGIRAKHNRVKTGSNFAFDPTTGALIVDSILDAKIRNAIMREVHRIDRRITLRIVRLKLLRVGGKLRLIPFKVKRIGFQAFYYIIQNLADFLRGRHDIRS